MKKLIAQFHPRTDEVVFQSFEPGHDSSFEGQYEHFVFHLTSDLGIIKYSVHILDVFFVIPFLSYVFGFDGFSKYLGIMQSIMCLVNRFFLWWVVSCLFPL